MCAVIRWIPQKKTRIQRLWEVMLDLWQPSSRRCDPKTWGMVLGRKMCRQVPGGRLWMTAMDLHMGKRDMLEPGGPRWDRAKKWRFKPNIFIWRMCESGLWESWGSTCACMKGRGAGSSQPAWLRNSRDRRSNCLQSKPNCKESFRQHRVRVEDDRPMSSFQLPSPLATKGWK